MPISFSNSGNKESGDLAGSPVAAAQRAELERIQAMQELLFERNPDGVAYADSSGVMTFNAAALAMLGVSQATDKDGAAAWQHKYGIFKSDGITPCPPEQMPIVMALRGEKVRDCELITKNAKNPAGLWVSCNADPMPNGQALAVFRRVAVARLRNGRG